MALREVIVEVTATYLLKVKASNAKEAMDKAENLVFDGIAPDYIDEISILDVQHLEE